jgi:predicted PurR-regulated permease PerM
VNRQQPLLSEPASPGAMTEHQTAADQKTYLPLIVACATIGIFLIMFGAMLYLTRAVLIPLAAAVIVGLTLAPLGRRVTRHRVPPWLFALLVVAALIATLHISTLLFSGPVSGWIERAPDLGRAVEEKLRSFDNALGSLRWLKDNSGGSGLKIDFASLIGPVLGVLTPAVSQLVIFLAMLFFVLISQDDLRRHFILIFPGQELRLRAIRILNDIEDDLARYVATVAVINAVLGCLTAIGAYVIGLPNPELWGVLAFLCNFVPYIGPALVLCILFAVGLINFPSLGHALIAPAFYLALTTLEGHFITPNIVGKRFTLSPLAVFLALVFWTWLWGPIGGFLAVPILIVGLVIFNHLLFDDDAALPG